MPEKMRLVKINGDNESLDSLLNVISDCGCFQPESADKYFSSSLGLLPYAEDNTYSQLTADIDSIFKSCGKSPVFDSSAVNTPLADEDIERMRLLQAEINKFAQKRELLLEQKAKCEEGITKFSHFAGLSVSLDDITDLEYVRVRFGHLPKESVNKLNAIFERCPYFYFVPCSTDKTDYWGAFFAPRNRIDEIDGIFATLLFEPFEIPGAAGTVDNVIKELKSNLEIVSNQLAELKSETSKRLKNETSFLNAVYSKLICIEEMHKLRSCTLHNDHYFMMAGWIPKSEEEKFLGAVREIKGISAESQIPDTKKDAPPVRMKKLWGPLKYLVDPYKFYVDMYGTPSYDDIDVTPFVAITYTILFGIMFGDMGQGFVLAVAGFLMYRLKGMGLGKILIPCGISSMVFGFLFGSVFGFEELLDPVYRALGWSGKPLEVMESVNTVLLLAIAIGIALTALSIVINIFALIKRKAFGEAIFSQNGLVGLLVYLSGVNFASGFMNGPAPLPNTVALIILGIGALLLLIKEIPIGIIDKHPDWKPDSILDFVLQNIFELLEYVLSYLSNTVSFLRVGAFVLVHAGMMMVVFSLAGDSMGVGSISVIILGNVLVIALEGLLTGIQALRLEYYEMFSRFYNGDGKPFTPFSNKKISFGGKQK